MPELTVTETILIIVCCLISLMQIAIMHEVSSIREELKKHYRTEAGNIENTYIIDGKEVKEIRDVGEYLKTLNKNYEKI